MVNRGCTFVMPDGRLCRASAIRGERFCYMHDPERAEEAAEARRLGGIRRRRERTLAGAYELGGVRTIEADCIRRNDDAIAEKTASCSSADAVSQLNVSTHKRGPDANA